MEDATAAAGAQRRAGLPATRRAWAAGLVVALVVPSGGCIAEVETEQRAGSVVGGRSEAGYPAVGYLLSDADTGTLQPVCGATVIRTNAAVTAAHCLVGATKAGIGFGEGGDERVAAVAIRHPDYDPNGWVRYRHDVAVLLFDEPLGVEPAEVGQARPGDAGRYIGYGRTTPGDHDVEEGYTFERKSAAQTVASDDGLNIWTRGVDGGLCWGDSGGPLMVDGSTTIVGVLADFDGVFDCQVGNRMIFTSLAGEDEFLQEALGGSGGAARGSEQRRCEYDCAAYGYGEGDCSDGWHCSDGCIAYDGCRPCQFACSEYGYAAGQCIDGWYCDGSCITYTGC